MQAPPLRHGGGAGIPSASGAPERLLFLLVVIPAIRIAEQRPMGDLVITVVAPIIGIQLRRAARMCNGRLDVLGNAPLGAVGYIAHAACATFAPGSV